MLLGILQIALTLLIVVVLVPILGQYMAQVFLQKKTFLDPFFRPLETLLYRLMGIRSERNMTGWQYAKSILISNIVISIFVFAFIMLQGSLPLNPTGISAPPWYIALHTTISFITNTDQQHYSGETGVSYGTQVFALGYLMFISAATGLAVGIAFIRGLTGKPLGNFYVDLTLSITRILLPLSIIGGIVFIILGVPETLGGVVNLTTLEGTTQTIARGPVAHFEIIKQLGENGGGFFGVNSAHPYENPSALTNLIQIVAMVIIPAALIYTYGVIAENKKQGWLLFWMVFIVFITLILIAAIGEFNGNPQVNQIIGANQPNLEGKEIRFGWAQSVLFAVTTTATMCGAVNAMHDSLMPAGGFVTLFNMFMQVIWGGQGTGTAYLFVFLLLSVFATGLMVGRTPEIFQRKVEKREIVLSSVVLLSHPIAILIPAAIALTIPGLAANSNPGFHGLSQVVYEYTSAAANNGSGFEGLGDSTPWWNLSTLFSLIIGRYLPIIALLLLADGMSQKALVPETSGTLRTDTVLFTVVTAGVLLILSALTFFPVLALGPIAEGFQIYGGS